MVGFLVRLETVSPALEFIEQRDDEVTRLEPGRTIDREMQAGQSHIYGLTLQAGQFLRVIAEQKGINLLLVLFAPDEKQVVEADFLGASGGGEESLYYEATTGGDYRLIVRAVGSATVPGAYQLRLETRAAATELDKQRRVLAERLSMRPSN
jgi:hypothetical protein